MQPIIEVDRRTHAILFVARLFMASLAVFGGLEKIVDYKGAVAYTDPFMPFAWQLMPFAIAVELVGAVALMIPSTCRIAATVLAVWTFVLGLWFHRFWAVPAAEWQMMIDSFFHHFVMTGGFVYVAIFGAPRRSPA